MSTTVQNPRYLALTAILLTSGTTFLLYVLRFSGAEIGFGSSRYSGWSRWREVNVEASDSVLAQWVKDLSEVGRGSGKGKGNEEALGEQDWCPGFMLDPSSRTSPRMLDFQHFNFLRDRATRPTVVFRPDESQDPSDSNYTTRTFWIASGDHVPPEDFAQQHHPDSFYPFAPFSADDEELPRFAQTPREDSRCPVFSIPSAGIYGLPNDSRLSPQRLSIRDFDARRRQHKNRRRATMREGQIVRLKGEEIMFGMATTPSRVNKALPIWKHWVPTADEGNGDRGSTIFILDEPLSDDLSDPEVRASSEANALARSLGINLDMRGVESERYETRYFSLVKEMWEEDGKLGRKAKWFVIADDDTFWPDVGALGRMLSKYDHDTPVHIGAITEIEPQRLQWGFLAYGGAGMALSSGLMGKMNEEGSFEKCLVDHHDKFGGDAMITHCAADVMSTTPEEFLTLEPSLHQLDIQGNDSTGFFQGGYRFTSLHHWHTWFSIFPVWHPLHDQNEDSVLLLGRVAKAIGGENFARRYIFDQGRTLVSLGYSVTVHSYPLSEGDYDRVEHTWFAYAVDYRLMRLPNLEGERKRNYLISEVSSPSEGVVVLTHVNTDGEKIDIVWDTRPR